MNTVKPSLFLSIVFSSFLIPTFAQRSSKTTIVGGAGRWYDGSIMVNDGTELVGLLRYNDDTGVLSFESGSISKSFTAKSVAGFEFFDEERNKQRVFYVFSYPDPQTDIVSPLFFEVVKEFKTFAVLSKTDPLQMKQKSHTTSGTTPSGSYGPGYTYTSTEILQVETIYIMDPNGQIMPYARIVEKEIDDNYLFDRSKVKNKLIDDELLETYTKPHYETLVKFADENKLSFKRKNDLVRILEHYQQLTAN
ncbi:hypothetical protein KK083_29995 [Fulvivirgaceae bacterium PWU4]|uniref:DUF4369 domain-containing protein n=1 Tax=Chryseosolibacter histidini TaxID=2782349 RepID=A0AAP2DRE1_9BACT|nr:hypothetical protein [Chryseosolibacter histidini]MBT1701161.1 hypothetical protein [Chryseosolibacter histidini]